MYHATCNHNYKHGFLSQFKLNKIYRKILNDIFVSNKTDSTHFKLYKMKHNFLKNVKDKILS